MFVSTRLLKGPSKTFSLEQRLAKAFRLCTETSQWLLSRRPLENPLPQSGSAGQTG